MNRLFTALFCVLLAACGSRESVQFAPPRFVSAESEMTGRNDVTLHCTLSDDRVESCGFLYGTDGNMDCRLECRLSGFSFEASISGLADGVDYSWCAFATAGGIEIRSSSATFCSSEKNPAPIEDPALMNYLLSDCDYDSDGVFSYDDAERVRFIRIGSTNAINLQSLKGIEYMPNLEDLVCQGEWDFRGPVGTLKYVDVSRNPKLKLLNLENNRSLGLEMGTIDLSANPMLKELNLAWNGLALLDLGPNLNLERLECGGNRLESIDVSSLTHLRFLDCSPMADDAGNNLLKTVCISPGQSIPGITEDRSDDLIPPGTRVECRWLYPPDDELWYTTVSHNTMYVERDFCTGLAMRSNTYENGKGVLRFNGTVSTFSEWAVYHDEDVESLTIPSGVKATSYSCFRENMHLKRVVFAPGLIVLGDSSLHHNEGLEEVILPDTVISIEKDALSHTYSLRHIDLPPRLETLGRSAFLHCHNLESIVLPSTLKSIGIYAFEHDVALRSVTCLAPEPPAGGAEMFDDTSECPIYVPAASVEAYRTAPYWSNYAHRIRAIEK